MGIVLKLRKTALLLLSGAVAMCVLIFSKNIREGVAFGLSLCNERVIPSLFLFTAVALFISYSGSGAVLGRLLSPVTKLLFGLEGDTATTWILSTVSGYPVGAKLVGRLFENGSISRAKALKTLVFSINAGPAFIVTAVGVGTLSSASDGRRLLISHLLATVIMAAFTRFLPDRIFSKESSTSAKNGTQSPDLLCVSDALVQSVSDAGRTMLTVCTFVVFFGGVGGMLSALPQKIGDTLSQIFEVTVGVQGCTRSQLELVAFLLGFGGFSVIFQVKAAAGRLKPSLWLIFMSRLVHGSLSAVIIAIAEIIFPRTVDTGSFGTAPDGIALHTSPFAAAALMLLCAVLLIFTHNSFKKQKLNG